jgi:hypothetical protein
VIGEVVGGFPEPVGPQDGRTSRFTLRGLSVLDGDRPMDIDVTDLQSQQCAGYVIARLGDRIAIAFDGHEFGQVVNAVAWLEGQPPDLVGIESTTVRAVYALVGRVPPAARPAASEQAAGPSIDGGVVVALALTVLLGFAGVLVWRRAHEGAT